MKKGKQSETDEKGKGNLRLAIVLVLTLGLAPFTPEPHVWGKIYELVKYFNRRTP